jgi:lysophospholipase L1-like esterase
VGHHKGRRDLGVGLVRRVAWAAVLILGVIALAIPVTAVGVAPSGHDAPGRSAGLESEPSTDATTVASPAVGSPPVRSLVCSVEATWSVPGSSYVTARLEYSFRVSGGWREPQSIPLAVTSADGTGESSGGVRFPLAGTWRIRQSLTCDGVVVTSPWVSVSVSAYRPKRTIRMVVFGDSLAGMPGIALKRMLAGNGASVTNDYKSSTGLSRPDFYDWPARARAEKRRLRPDVVIMMFGANDWQNIRSGGHVYTRGTKSWDAVYAARAGRLMDIARAGDTVVYVVGQPNTGRSAGYARHMAHINGLAEREARKRPDVRFISTWALFSTPSGAYASSLRTSTGELVRMRSGDKIHFTGAGASRLARELRRVIQIDWRRFS